MSLFDYILAAFTNLVTSWWFWLICGISIVSSAVHHRLKKNRKAQKKRRKRFEKEVEQSLHRFLQNHVTKTAPFQNVAFSYVDHITRSGKQYNRRAVFDVFVKIYDKRVKNQKPIYKCYEIEGFPRYADPKDKNSAVLIDWKINAEFDYEIHKKLLKKLPR